MRRWGLAVAILGTVGAVAGCLGDPGAADPLEADSYAVDVHNLPQDAVAGQEFPFHVGLMGPTEYPLDHVSAHAQGEAAATHECGPVAVPFGYDVDLHCALPSPGNWTLRAHLQVTDSTGKTWDYWGEPVVLNVRAA